MGSSFQVFFSIAVKKELSLIPGLEVLVLLRETMEVWQVQFGATSPSSFIQLYFYSCFSHFKKASMCVLLPFAATDKEKQCHK
jgi:hypothetical protein